MSDQRELSRRRLLQILVASGGAVAGSTLLLEKWVKPVIEVGVLPAHAQISNLPTSSPQIFNCMGTQQSFVVPAGVTQVTIEAWGAQGGGSQNDAFSYGLGGFVSAV